MIAAEQTSRDGALQPLLNDSVIALHAPTQVWSAPSGDVGGKPIHGIFHGDLRHIREVTVTYDGLVPENISVAPRGAPHVTFGSLLRRVDDLTPDPKVRLWRTRVVGDGIVTETLTVRSHLDHEISVPLRVRIVPDFMPLQEIKAGEGMSGGWSSTAHGTGVTCVSNVSEAHFTVDAPDSAVVFDDDALVLEFVLRIAPRGSADATWTVLLTDPGLVVCGASSPQNWNRDDVVLPDGVDGRIHRWLDTALSDLDALRLALPDHPEDEFFAAGAPWFLTLFGRDSLWAARLSLPLDRTRAASTLRVLARLQGDRRDPATAQQPGKILHELRGAPLALPGEGLLLPPVYYGTVDATPLWVCLLAEAWREGMPDAEVRELLPTLRGALDWMMLHGDGDGDGFLDYIDETGHGLANQGWKDSGDSIQWRTGELAQGPIALCEVQGYAYEAAVAGAEILDHFGEPGGHEVRAWGSELKRRFAEAFWVETPEGRYPAIALDARKRPVDTLTSNIGHLLGTGILSDSEEAQVAELLVRPQMLSGFGVRTMSTEASGFWPLSYHGGSVWAHDSAIIAHGMARAGQREAALQVVGNLLDAAEGFGYRVPELHSGEARSEAPTPVPYPAACRPQAWSAAAAIVCMSILAE